MVLCFKFSYEVVHFDRWVSFMSKSTSVSENLITEKPSVSRSAFKSFKSYYYENIVFSGNIQECNIRLEC